MGDCRFWLQLVHLLGLGVDQSQTIYKATAQTSGFQFFDRWSKMNAEFPSRMPWLALTLLGSAYALFGWYLSAHHILWVVGVFVALATLAIAWRGMPIVEHLSLSKSSTLFGLIILGLLLSLPAALIIGGSLFLNLIFLPIATMFFAEIEMRSAGFRQLQLFLYLTLLAGIGIGIGEAIDLVVLPSARF